MLTEILPEYPQASMALLAYNIKTSLINLQQVLECRLWQFLHYAVPLLFLSPR